MAASTVRVIASPGKTAVHQATRAAGSQLDIQAKVKVPDVRTERLKLAVRELRQTGVAKLPVPYVCKNQPAIFALALIYGFIDFKKAWHRILLAAAAFPLAVIGNVVRLSVIIVAAEMFAV